MPNNPVQVVLNTEKFLGRPDRPPGGKVKDFFADRDVQFANHKRRVLSQIADIHEQIQNELGIEYAHVTLQSDAFAKSHRPFQALLPPDRVPLIGGGKFGELIVEFTTENLPAVENAIRRAEDVVVFRVNKEGEEEPRPTRARSEVGAISSIRAHEPVDRRAFSAEEAVAWLDDPRTGGLYIIETFVDPAELSAAKSNRVQAKVALSSFLEKMDGLDVGVETIKAPPRFRGHRLLFLKLARRKSESRKERVARHQTFLEFVEKQAAVRRVLLPPLIEPGQAVHGNPGDAIAFPLPHAAGDFPVVGVVDTGAANIPSLEAWCVGRTDFVGSGSGQDRSHGTFIAGLTVASGQLNSHSVLAEPPCKFFDLALFPTGASQFASFFPNGFLDFLQQLEEELGAAKAAGARVFNMSLSLERQVTDDRYGFFASYIDQIVDKQDILLVLPSGNLGAAQCRNEWPDSPPKVLKMLAEYRHSDKDRVLEPAESVRAVVVGALNPPSCVHAPLRPATYTRRGPSTALGTKPDVAHVGGKGTRDHELFSIDTAGRRIDGCGTSYAAPLVAKALAHLDQMIDGDVRRETLIALLTHHATLPGLLGKKTLAQIARDFVGFGLPSKSTEMLATDDHSITLLFVGDLEAKRELNFPFTWPTSLVRSNGRCRGRVRLTLAYRPPTDRRFDAEFVRINLDAYLRQEKVNRETGEVMGWEGRLNSETDKRYERSLIQHGQKWWPIKQYERRMTRVGSSSQWHLVIEGLARAGAEFPDEGVPFAVMLTIADTAGRADVFREARQGLIVGGARLGDVRTANRVTRRV